MVTTNPIIDLAIFLSMYSPVIFFGVWIFRKRKVDQAMTILGVAVIASFLSDLISFLFFKKGLSTYIIINVYNLVDLLIFLLYFKFMLRYKGKSHFLFVIIAIVTVFLASKVGINSIWNTAIAVKNVFLSLLAITLLLNIFNYETEIYVENISGFWVSIGIILYGFGTFFLWLMSIEFIGISRPSWMISLFLNFSKNILFTIGLWKAKSVQ